MEAPRIMMNSFPDFTAQLIADMAAGVKPAYALAGLNEMLTAAPGRPVREASGSGD